MSLSTGPPQESENAESLTRTTFHQLDRVKRIWYLSPMRAAKVQASLRIRAVSPEPPLLAHISTESRGTFRQKARSLTLLNGWACAVKICHDGMFEDTNSLEGAHIPIILANGDNDNDNEAVSKELQNKFRHAYGGRSRISLKISVT